MRKQEHNYELRGYKFGFRIIPKDEKRPIIHVNVDKNGFWHFKEYGKYDSVPLYNFYILLGYCVESIYETWILSKETNNLSVNMMMTQWAKMNTRKTLAKKMRDIWKNCCNNLDPDVEELHRKLHSISNGSGYWGRIEDILNNRREYKFLIKDMLKYPAARLAVLHGHLEGSDYHPARISEWDLNWMREYSFNDEGYTSLKKTLMNFPYGVTYYYYFALQNIKLPEPVTSRIRMYAYTTLARMRFEGDEIGERMKVILRSTDEQLKDAVRYLWKYFPMYTHDNFRRSGSIIHSFHMIFDYPLPIGEWDIMGLAKRSEEYHHDLDMQARVERMRLEQENEKLAKASTALPPIPLPKDEKIKFLDSYKSVQDEGELMGHCIGQYAKSAINGSCYLFHVDYNGEMASVEVSPYGYVSQSYGPRDTRNIASEYGKKVLGSWGKKLEKAKKEKEPLLCETNVYEYGEVPF